LGDLRQFLTSSFWIGWLLGVASNLVASVLIFLWRPSRMWATRQLNRFLRWVNPIPQDTSMPDVFGFDERCHVIRFGGGRGLRLEATYNNTQPVLDPTLSALRREVDAEAKAKAWSNQKGYALLAIDPKPHDIEDEPLLQVDLGPTDYFTFQATNRKLDERLGRDGPLVRDRYLSNCTWKAPVQPFANCLSVNVMVLTTDGRIVGQRRAKDPILIGMYAGYYSLAFGETLSRDKDPFVGLRSGIFSACAVRGLDEEVGLEISPTRLTFISLQVTEEFAQWGLIAIAKTSQTFSEIKQRAEIPSTTHRWEFESLHPIPFDPELTAPAMHRLSRGVENWVPGSYAGAALSLIYAYPAERQRILDNFAREFASRTR
jgi:8-oxo-dGTP pyrophosphatase MutT (NUDIX family)